MGQATMTMGQRIAQAGSAFEQRRTKHGRKWVTVFLSEDTMVIVLHGSLTPAEKTLAKSPAGAAQVQEFHRQLFANASGSLRRKIKRITGMAVRDMTAAVETTTGSVVQVLTTDTVVQEFLLARSVPAGHPHRERSRRNGLARHALATGQVVPPYSELGMKTKITCKEVQPC